MASVDSLTRQVADYPTENRSLQKQVRDLLSQISVGNKVRFGSTSLKGTKKKAAPVQDERQGAKRAKIVQQLRQRLDKLLADTGGMRGDLMQKALNYLKSIWNQLFLYLKDGRYNIDNSLAKRMLRPMTIERKRSISDRLLPKGRKNSLTFGSHAGVELSVIYHTFIETCQRLNILRNSLGQSCKEEPTTSAPALLACYQRDARKCCRWPSVLNNNKV